MNTYKDTKELPLWNYKRILQTNSFFYMIKGYDGEEIEANEEELKALFQDVIKDHALSMNSVNSDIVNYGKIEQAKLKVSLLLIPLQIIELQVRKNELRMKLNIEIDNSIIDSVLENVKIPKTDDLEEQIKIIKSKIEKYQTEINEAIAKIKKDNPDAEIEVEYDIDEVILNTALMLETTIDERKTSLHQFSILQKQARKKAEHLAKLNQK